MYFIDTKYKVKEVVDQYKETFETALEMEEDDQGWFDLNGLTEALKGSDILVNDDQYDYLVYLLYLNTKDVKLLKRALNAGGNKNNASLSSIKEENNSKDESNLELSPEKRPKSSNEGEEYSVFEEERKMDQSEGTPLPFEPRKAEKSVEVEQSEDAFEPNNEKDINNKSDELDREQEEISEQQILNFAEGVFARIGQEMLRRNLTTTILFKNDIKTVKIQNKTVDIINTTAFINGLKALGIFNLSQNELKSTLSLLSKDSESDVILIKDIIDVLMNFGVTEFDTSNADNTNDEGYTETEDPRRRKKKTLNFESLSKESLNVLAVFTDFLLDTDTSVYEFFDGFIFNQIVKTKNKQNSVEIMATKDFFTKIREWQELMRIIDSHKLSDKTEGKVSFIIL
jgi:hypothetical protein